jgi:EAL domain-containing protein (putative c-di-GMP-specific phosphodiesterase class I)
MAHEDAIALIANDDHDRQRLQQVLDRAETGTVANLYCTLDELRNAPHSPAFGLVAYWPGAAEVTAEAVRDELAQWTQPTVLLLVISDDASYPHRWASALDARGFIDLSDPAQTAFTLQRERHHLDMRTRLGHARQQLAQTQIVDESHFAQPIRTVSQSPIADTIDRALQTDALELLFQPIVGLREDTREIYEVFTRIRGEQRYLEPAEFIPVAWRYGLMPALDRWVVRNAAERYAAERATRYEAEARALSFFLNIAAPTLVEAPSINRILRALANQQPGAGAFVLELDKSTIVSRLKLAKSLNQLIKRRKLAFAIDEYEDNDTRLNYARHISVDYVKLGRSTIAGIDRDPSRREAVAELIQSAQATGLRVVATRVERTAELVPLYHAGVDYVQGHLIARPTAHVNSEVTADEIIG